MGNGELLVTSIFSFSQNVFFSIKDIIYTQIVIRSEHAFNLDKSTFFSYGEDLEQQRKDKSNSQQALFLTDHN